MEYSYFVPINASPNLKYLSYTSQKDRGTQNEGEKEKKSAYSAK